MNKTAFWVALAVFGVFFVILLAMGIGFGAEWYSAASYGNSTESDLMAIQTANRNHLAQYGQTVTEQAQITGLYAGDLQKVVATDVQGRYGPNGSSATMQWFKEHNIQLDPAMYVKLQRTIEAGRHDFENGQNRQTDELRQYRTALGAPIQGFFLRFAGYPHINLKDFDIVSTGRADEAFRTKQEGTLQIRTP